MLDQKIMDSEAYKSDSPAGSGAWEVIDFLLRLLAIGATVVAAVVMARDKQTVETLVGPIYAKYHYSPANVFFVAANVIACVYCVFAINNTVANILTRRSPAFSKLLRGFFDLIMAALLSAGVGAALAIGYVARKGNSHAFWNERCSLFERFCHHGAIAIAASFVATVVFILLTTFSLYSLYQRSR